MKLPASRACLGCRRTIARGRRCADCAPAHEKRRHNRAYDTGEYRRARNAAVAAWVREHGHVCPGDAEHPAHPCRTLSADHPIALARGGPIVQEFRIRCLSSNSRRGARDER